MANILLKMRKTPNKESACLVLVLLLALVLRLANLSTEPFWGDEIFTLGLVKYFSHDTAGLIAYLDQIFIYPPLYLLILKLLAFVFGYSESAVRVFSVMSGLLCVWAVYFFTSRVFFNKRVALLAAFITAILPLQIEFSQEARGYILLCLFGLINVFSLWLFLQERKNFWLLCFFLSALAGLYTHYSFVLVLLATLGYWAIHIFFISQEKPRESIRLLMLGLALFVLYFRWAVVALYNYILIKEYIFLDILGGATGFKAAWSFEKLASSLVWASRQIDVSQYEILAAALFKIVLLYFLFFRIKPDKKPRLVNDRPVLVYLFYIFFALLVLFLLFPQSSPYVPLMAKHIIAASAILGIILAYLVFLFDPKIRLLLLALFCISLLGYNARILGDDSLADPYFQARAQAEFVNELYRPGDLVIVYPAIARTNINYYLSDNISAVGFNPLLAMENDWHYTRHTLGFLENQSHFRYQELPREQEAAKIDYLLDKHDPNRVWLIEFPISSRVPERLIGQGWQSRISPVGDRHRIRMLSRQ